MITKLLQEIPNPYQPAIDPIVANPHLRQLLISKTHETLRLLNSKTTHGQLLCSADSPEARSVVVLEYVLRNGFYYVVNPNHNTTDSNDDKVMKKSPSMRVPLEVLGKIVGIGKKDIGNVGRVCNLRLNQMYNDNNSAMGNSTQSQGKKQNQHPKQINTSNIHERNAAKILSMAAKHRGSRSHYHSTTTTARTRSSTTSNSSNSILKMNAKSRNDQINAVKAQRMMSSVVRMGISNNNSSSVSTATTTINASVVSNDPNGRKHEYPKITSSSSLSVQIANLSNNTIHIQTLSINLQSYLIDPNNVECKSKQLWSNLLSYKLNLQKQYNRPEHAVLFDLRTHFIYYQGACFYVTVHDLEHGLLMSSGYGGGGAAADSNDDGVAQGNGLGTTTHGRSSKSATSNKSRKKSKNFKQNVNGSNYAPNKNNSNNDHQEHGDEDDENLILSVEHIIHELRIDETIFTNILNEVTTSVRNMGDMKYHGCSSSDDNDNNKEGNKKGNCDKKRSCEDVVSSIEMTSEKRPRLFMDRICNSDDDESGIELKRSNSDDQAKSNVVDDDMPSWSKARYTDEKRFMKWKQKMLSSMQVTQRTNSNCDDNSLGNDNEEVDPSIIKERAKNILRKFKEHSK